MKQLRVTVQGKVYEVTVEVLEGGGRSGETGQPQLSVTPGAAIAAPVTPAPQAANMATDGNGNVLSPLAGKVVAVQVTKGQAVKQGDQLIVLEAMKMNTYIYAPQDGTVEEIFVKVGDAAAEGQVVVRIV